MKKSNKSSNIESTLDLELPVIKGANLKKRHLSMDDYLDFVMFNLKYTVDIAAARNAKKDLAVHAPFSLQ